MDVWSPSAVPVGILRWNGPTNRLTIIAKMTLVPKAGTLVLADEQEPLRAAIPSTLGVSEELHYPGDFVPFKPRCDVLVVGSAYAQQPSSIIPVQFRVGALERRVYALAGQPSTSIPLSSRYLRLQPVSHAEEAAIGPLSVQHAHRARFADTRIPAQATGFELTTLPADFDGRFFNAAPAEQQIDPLTPGVAFVAPWRGDTQIMWVPPMRPRIFVFDQSHESGLREMTLVCDTVWIDLDRTRCVLTFRGVVDPRYGSPFPTALVAVFASAYDAVLAGAAKAICARASVRPATEPKDVEGFVPEPAWPPPSQKSPISVRSSAPPKDDDGTKVYPQFTPRTATIPFASKTLPPDDDGPKKRFSDDDEPGTRILTNVVPRVPAPRSRTFHDDEPGTSVLTNLADLMARSTTLPFVPTQHEPADKPSARLANDSQHAPRAAGLPFVSTTEAPDEGPGAHMLPNTTPRAPVLPFAGASRAFDALSDSRIAPGAGAALPFVQVHRAADTTANRAQPSSLPGPSTIIPDLTAPATVLPFVPASRPLDAWPDASATPPKPQRAPGALNSEVTAPQSVLPFVSTEPEQRPGAAPIGLPFVSNESITAPIATAPTTLDTSALIRISLDTFAEIKVDLWSGVGLREALTKHGIDQRTYHLFERRHADELGDELRQGALDRTQALRAALRRARERRAPISADDGLL